MAAIANTEGRRSLALIGHEYAALDTVPDADRHFGLWDQAAFWFAATCLPAAWFYGALMAGAAGLPGALLLILVISPLSLAPWALIGWIAARTGACSTALVRPAFGLRGLRRAVGAVPRVRSRLGGRKRVPGRNRAVVRVRGLAGDAAVPLCRLRGADGSEHPRGRRAPGRGRGRRPPRAARSSSGSRRLRCSCWVQSSCGW